VLYTNLASLDPHYSQTAAMPALTTGHGGEAAGSHHSVGGGGGGGGLELSFSHDAAPSLGDGDALHANDMATLNSASLPLDAGTLPLGDGLDQGNILPIIDPGVAADLGLDLNPLHLGAEIGGDLLSGTPLDVSLDLKALGLDINVEHGLLSGLVGEVGGSTGDILDGSLGAPVSHLVEDVTGLNLSGPLDGLKGVFDSADSDIGKTVTSLGDVLDQGSQSLLAPVTTAVADIVPDGAHSLSLGELGGMTNGDSIVFPNVSVSAASQTDSLFSGGQYTDYNLTLQTTSSDSAGSTGTAAAHEDSDTAGVGADIHDSHDSVIGHAVDAPLTDLSGADHEVRLSI
jgi:hypothetical protein